MMKSYSCKKADEHYFDYLNNPANIPFSFICGGKKYKGFGFSLNGKTTVRTEEKEDSWLIDTLDDGIEIDVKLTHYFSHGATEFTVYFANNTDRNSLIIEKPQIEVELMGENPVLKGIYGDHTKYYEPYCFDLCQKDVRFTSDSGRATHANFPYFNLEYGMGGTMLAIGWAGTCTAEFKKTKKGVSYKGRAVNNMKTCIKPSEKIRTEKSIDFY